ncbi:MAG: FAD-dependent oxidoreductase, partial [Pseudomonadales bacterium]
MAEPTVLIVGGGIGGLTSALCLAKDGCKVSVFEQAPAFAEVGAGIQLSPNCTRVLHHLGLETALRAKAFLPEGTQFR